MVDTISNDSSELEEHNEQEDKTSDEDLGYTSKSEFNKALVSLKAFEDVREKRAKEMTRGGDFNRFDKMGNVCVIHQDDTREAFISAMISLDVVLEPDCDEEYSEARKKKEEKLEEGFNNMASRNMKMVSKMDGTSHKEFCGTPHIVRNSEGWHQWIDYQVVVFTQLFREASKLIHRKKYFKQGLSFG